MKIVLIWDLVFVGYTVFNIMFVLVMNDLRVELNLKDVDFRGDSWKKVGFGSIVIGLKWKFEI